MEIIALLLTVFFGLQAFESVRKWEKRQWGQARKRLQRENKPELPPAPQEEPGSEEAFKRWESWWEWWKGQSRRLQSTMRGGHGRLIGQLGMRDQSSGPTPTLPISGSPPPRRPLDYSKTRYPPCPECGTNENVEPAEVQRSSGAAYADYICRECGTRWQDFAVL